MDFFNDVAVGAVTPGTNPATLIALHVVLLLALFSLILLLAIGLTSYHDLVPHIAVLIFLVLGLWGLMIWLTGVASDSDQQQQAPAAAPATPGEEDTKKRE